MLQEVIEVIVRDDSVNKCERGGWDNICRKEGEMFLFVSRRGECMFWSSWEGQEGEGGGGNFLVYHCRREGVDVLIQILQNTLFRFPKSICGLCHFTMSAKNFEYVVVKKCAFNCGTRSKKIEAKKSDRRDDKTLL